MSLPDSFPAAFRDPNIDPVLDTALGQVFAIGTNEQYETVPLVIQSFRDNVLGNAAPQDALLLGADASTGVMKLQSVSSTGKSTEELAKVAYSLVEPLANPINMDLGAIILKTMEGGYSALSGVITLGREKTNTEYGALVVPNIYKFGVYDMLDMDDNPAHSKLSREEVSTNISASILYWAIQMSTETL